VLAHVYFIFYCVLCVRFSIIIMIDSAAQLSVGRTHSIIGHRFDLEASTEVGYVMLCQK